MNTKTAVITGASRGIGRALALHLAKAGYDLAICAHSRTDSLAEVCHQVTAQGRRCVTYLGDMGNAASVQDFFGLILQEYPTIDVLINNAGISYVGLLQDMTDDQWDQILRTNLSSAFYCCRQVIPAMLSQKRGHILNISSVWGNVGASTEVAYSATKGGINAFTRALAKELAPSHICVNAIACGYIDTDMNGHLNETERQQLCDEIPAGRPGTPEDVATLAVSMLQNSDYLTGQIISLDGGWI